MKKLKWITAVAPLQLNCSSIAMAAILALTGCGDDSAKNIAPSVSVTDISVVEGASVELTAIVSDSDGSVVSYAWQQTSGSSVTLVDTTSSTASFTAPRVTADETLTFTITATDDDGDSTSASLTVDITAIMLTVNLAGMVTDDPISYANVAVSIGDQSFATQADEDGNYTVEVSVDDAYENSVVRLTATGSEDNSAVKLVSYLGTTADIVSAAGDGNTVTAEELFATNITNVSTATAAALELANGGEITTETGLQSAQLNLDSALILPFATAIKLVLDYAQDYPELSLPEGVTDTYALVSDSDTISEYVNYVQNNAQDTYDLAVSAILSDSQLVTSAIDESSIADTYYFLNDGGSYGIGYQLTLTEGGSGQQLSLFRDDTGDGTTALTWAVSENDITITYSDPEVSVSYLTSENASIAMHTSIISRHYSILTDFGSSVILSTYATTLTDYPNGEYSASTETSEPETRLAYKSSGVQTAAGLLEMGVEYIMPTPSVYESGPSAPAGVNADDAESFTALAKITFSGDPDTGGNATLGFSETDFNGTTTYSDIPSTWSIDESGKLIIENSEFYSQTAVLNPENQDILHSSILLTESSGNSRADSGRYVKNSADWQTEDIPGIYALDWDVFTEDEYFWLEFYADGTGLQVWVYPGSDDDLDIYVYDMQWQLEDDDTLSIRRYINPESRVFWCTPSEFDPSPQDTCNLYHERTAELYSIAEIDGKTRYQILHFHKWFRDPWARWDNPDYTSHILESLSAGERYWVKLDDRPVAIDEQAIANTPSRIVNSDAHQGLTNHY